MPFPEKITLPDGWIVVREIRTSEEFYVRTLTLSEENRTYLNRLRTPARRREWLAWQLILREELGADVRTGYADTGAPRLLNRDGQIAVTHSGNLVAVRYATGPCGIDLENCGRDFDQAARRILSPEERTIVEKAAIPAPLCVAWCAKEAVFKSAGIPGLDFRKDMVVTNADSGRAELTVRLKEQAISVRWLFGGGHCLAYTL